MTSPCATFAKSAPCSPTVVSEAIPSSTNPMCATDEKATRRLRSRSAKQREAAPQDAGDAERAEHGRQGADAVGHRGDGDADHAVGAELEQHAGEQHGAAGRSDRVRRREPGVQREHRRLHRQAADDQGGGDHLFRGAEGRIPEPGAGGERRDVGGAGAERDEQQPEQHHRRAQCRVEDEAVGGVTARALAGRRGCGQGPTPRAAGRRPTRPRRTTWGRARPRTRRRTAAGRGR